MGFPRLHNIGCQIVFVRSYIFTKNLDAASGFGHSQLGKTWVRIGITTLFPQAEGHRDRLHHTPEAGTGSQQRSDISRSQLPLGGRICSGIACSAEESRGANFSQNPVAASRAVHWGNSNQHTCLFSTSDQVACSFGLYCPHYISSPEMAWGPSKWLTKSIQASLALLRCCTSGIDSKSVIINSIRSWSHWISE